jgi:hypothetical protein
MGFTHLWPHLPRQTTVRLDRLEFVQVLEMGVCQSFVGERPQPFGGRQGGRVRGQNVLSDPRRYPQLGAHMQPCAVEHEDDLCASPGTDRVGKLGAGHDKSGHGHRGASQPPGPARLRRHQGVEITPLGAMRQDRLWALSTGTPDTTQAGLEPDAVWGGRPQCHLLLRVRLLQGLDYGRKGFLKAAWAVGAALAWGGRGPFEVHPRRGHISQPRGGWTRWPRVAAIQAAALGPVQTPPSGGGCLRAAASAAVRTPQPASSPLPPRKN